MCVSTTGPHTQVVVMWCPYLHEKTTTPVMEKIQDLSGCVFSFWPWHDTQAFANCWMSVRIRGHTNLSITSHIDALAPGCDWFYMNKNNVLRNVFWTNGRTCPLLVLRTTFKSLFGTYIFDNFKDVELSWRSCCNCLYFLCYFTKFWYSTHVSSRRALMPRNTAFAGTWTSPSIKQISEVNCNR